MDEMPGVDTCGRPKMPGMFELIDRGERLKYAKEREEAERKNGATDGGASTPQYDPDSGGYVDDNGDPVSYDAGPAPDYDEEQGTYVDDSGNPVSYLPRL